MYDGDYLLSYNNGTNPSSTTYKGWLLDTANNTWTISSYGFNFLSASTYYWCAWDVRPGGNVYSDSFFYYDSGSLTQHSFAVRPVLYLKSDVVYKSGSGTISDPIRIG